MEALEERCGARCPHVGQQSCQQNCEVAPGAAQIGLGAIKLPGGELAENDVAAFRLREHSIAERLCPGNDEWQFPIPIVRHGGRWLFDTEAGRQRLNPDLTWKPVAQDSHP